MRRAAVALSLLLAVGGLAIAFTLPSGRVPDCPRPPDPHMCIYMTDTRPWLRFAVGMAAVLPAVILIGAWYRGNRKLAWGMLIAGISVAFVLWWIGGLLPATGGDCPPYPRCYTMGHPYGGPAFIVLLITAGVSFWLWPDGRWLISEGPRSTGSSSPWWSRR